jgi:hypothetical protein
MDGNLYTLYIRTITRTKSLDFSNIIDLPEGVSYNKYHDINGTIMNLYVLMAVTGLTCMQQI